ncbi:MAG: hypothetical protein OEU54_14205 [Gemmatimonadota bacterium]|nr:hypothetical protein [Gemmatimonadota bacterium]
MRTVRIALLAGATLVAGCRSLADVQVTDLEGQWIASQARFVEIAAPKRNNEDLIQLGWDVEMDIDGAGNFVLSLFIPDDDDDIVLGSLTVTDGRQLGLLTENGEGEGEVFLEDDQVAFRLTAGLEFNFGDGRVVPSRLILVLDRTGG